MDVCKALAYNVKADGTVNTTNALAGLGTDEVITARISDNPGKTPEAHLRVRPVQAGHALGYTTTQAAQMLGCHSAVAPQSHPQDPRVEVEARHRRPHQKRQRKPVGWPSACVNARGASAAFPRSLSRRRASTNCDVSSVVRKLPPNKPTGLYVRGRCSMNSARSSIPRSASRFALGVP